MTFNYYSIINKPFDGRVIFDHLPKTAGMAVNAWLRSTFGTGVVTDNLIGIHEELIRRYGGEYSIISGHVGYTGVGMDSRYSYVTCLREPLDRAISWLFYLIQQKNELDLHEKFRCAQQFLDSDGQCEVPPGFIESFCCLYINHFCSHDSQLGVTDAEKIEKSLSVLDRYDVWGFYEEMPSFLADFSSLLGIPPPKEFARVNVTRQRPKVDAISPKLLARLNELTALDQEFYRQAKARYAQARTRFFRHPAGVVSWQRYDRPAPMQRVYSAPEYFLTSARMEPEGPFHQGDSVIFKVDFSLARAFDELEMGIHIFDSDGRWAFGTNTTLLGQPLRGIRAGTHQVSYVLALSLPEGDYTVGFACLEVSPDGKRELAWFDRLLDFRVNLRRDPPCAGYVSLPTTILHHQSGFEVRQPVTDGRGNVELSDCPTLLSQSQSWQQPVVLHNTSSQDWHDSMAFPLALSYHWLNEQGEIVIFDGHRTSLPNGGIRAGQSVSTQLNVETPSTPGRYRLQVLPVIDNQCWLDEIGFAASEVALEVVSTGQCTDRR